MRVRNDQGRPHNGIVNVEVAGARYTTVKKTGHSTRTIILGNQNKQTWLTDILDLGAERSCVDVRCRQHDPA